MAITALAFAGKSLLGGLMGGDKKADKKDPSQNVTPKTPKVSGVKPNDDAIKPKEDKKDDAQSTKSPRATKVSASSPLLRKTGIVSIDKSLTNVSKSLGNIKGTIASQAQFDKKKREEAKKAKTKSKRKKKEKSSEKGPVGQIMSAIGKVVPFKSIFDTIFKFFMNIVLGTLVIFIVDNIEKIVEGIGEIIDKVKEFFKMMNKWVVKPIFNMVKAIAGPINTAINALAPKDLPDFDKENKDIEDELDKLGSEKNIIVEMIPGLKDLIKGFDNLLKYGDPRVDKEEFDQQVRDRAPAEEPREGQRKPPTQRGDSNTGTGRDGGFGTGTTGAGRPSDGAPQPPTQRGGSTGGGGDYETKLAKILGNYEGLRLEAYADANYGWEIPTIGIGATKYPPGFRLKGKVQKGDVITEEEAYMIKAHDIKEHRQRLLRELPSSIYNKLPDGVKAALESKVFNYGSLGKTLAGLVTEASKTGNFKPVADHFRNVLANHNGGINSWRRNDEAGMIMSGKSARVGVSFGTATPSREQRRPPTQRSNAIGSGLTDLVSRQGLDKLYGAPTGPVRTSERGMRGGRHHAGIDFGTGGQKGWFCAFKMTGTVSFVGSLSGYGKTVIINSGGYDFLFAHLAKYNVREGESYNGQVIGEIGNTGVGSGEHLHFEVRTKGGANGSDVDPNPYVQYLEIGRMGDPTSTRQQQVQPQISRTIQRGTGIDRNMSYNSNRNTTVVMPVATPSRGGGSTHGGGAAGMMSGPNRGGIDTNKQNAILKLFKQ